MDLFDSMIEGGKIGIYLFVILIVGAILYGINAGIQEQKKKDKESKERKFKEKMEEFDRKK